jgi:hypothetical protein
VHRDLAWRPTAPVGGHEVDVDMQQFHGSFASHVARIGAQEAVNGSNRSCRPLILSVQITVSDQSSS